VDAGGVTRWKFIPLKASGAMVWFNIAMEPPRVENGSSGLPEKIVLAITSMAPVTVRLVMKSTPHRTVARCSAAPGRGQARGWRALAPGMFGLMHVFVEDGPLSHLQSPARLIMKERSAGQPRRWRLAPSAIAARGRRGDFTAISVDRRGRGSSRTARTSLRRSTGSRDAAGGNVDAIGRLYAQDFSGTRSAW